MSWIQNNSTQNRGDIVTETGEQKPSTNLIAFLGAEGLEDWPLLESFEEPIDYKSDALLCRTQDDIVSMLEKAASLRFDMFDDIEKRLSDLEVKLNMHADQIVVDNRRSSDLAHLYHSPSRTFMTDMSESDSVEVHRSTGVHKSLDLADMLLQTRKKSLDFFKFPGFVHGKFIELPSKLEAPIILHHISRVNNFNTGFRKFWMKIFLSEASSAVMQDSFWWIFLDKFNKEAGFEVDKDLLFDRIADSYAALFTSINIDVKDKFMSVYPDCLSQSLYCTYKEAFPESKMRFDDEFKHYLVNLISEWLTGLHPVVGRWNFWNEENLKLDQIITHDETTKKVVEAAAVCMKVESSIDIDACTKVIDKLGTNERDLTQSSSNQENTNISRAKKIESHQIGPGPEYERVKFNISGRSPLISHYLHMLQLRSDQQPGIKVKRTEIVKLPPESITYQQFITSTLNRSDALKKEYTRVHEQTSTDILDLKRQQRDTNKEMNVLKKALTNSKNAQERCLAIEAIMEYNERDKNEIPLIGYQSPEAASDSSASGDEEGT